MSFKPWSPRVCTLQAGEEWSLGSVTFDVPAHGFQRAALVNGVAATWGIYCHLLPLAAPRCWLSWPKAGWEFGLWILCLGLHQQCNLHPAAWDTDPWQRSEPDAESEGICPCQNHQDLSTRTWGHFGIAGLSDAQTLLQLWLWETCLSHAASQQHPAGDRQVSWLPAQCSSQSLASTCTKKHSYLYSVK